MSEPQIPLEPIPVIDKTNGYLVSPRPSLRQRTGHVSFECHYVRNEAPAYVVRAWGEPMFPDEGPPWLGKLSTTFAKLNQYIEECLGGWHRAVLEYEEPERLPTQRRPFFLWDPTTSVSSDRAEEVWLRLAEAGRKLFRLLFLDGDETLKRITHLLVTALRDGEQVIAFHSDVVFAPWWMLYTPLDPADETDGPLGRCTKEGFWGYRHWVEHQLDQIQSRPPNEIHVGPEGVRVGLHVDRRIDRSNRDMPFIGPLIEFFTETTMVSIRTTKNELAAALATVGFADQLIIFACHGQAGGSPNDDHRGGPALKLSDDELIQASDIHDWLREHALRTNPIVFICACYGGRLHDGILRLDSYGRELLLKGANCLIGPQIELPIHFGREYMRAFFKLFCQPGTRLGDALRHLARDCADRQQPLGLALAMYRGLNTHLVADET